MENKVDPLNTEQVNTAAKVFSTAIRQFKNRVGLLPAKSIRRVFAAAVEFPLSEGGLNLRNQAEIDLFKLTIQLLDAKITMTDAIMRNNVLKEQETKKEIEDVSTTMA